MARRLLLSSILSLFTLVAQKPPATAQEPPEEDSTLVEPKEYTFNPLQAEKEVRTGNFYAKKGNFKAAATRYREATKWNPGLADAWLRLGEALEKRKDMKGAKEAYAKYLELAPDAKNVESIKKKL
ncbi:MAG: tetratricopeptide repeat protein [Acidobacteria bacterium]|nr:tetratricopeptide repeat protein [Acidobacteriota bacterium]